MLSKVQHPGGENSCFAQNENDDDLPLQRGRLISLIIQIRSAKYIWWSSSRRHDTAKSDAELGVEGSPQSSLLVVSM